MPGQPVILDTLGGLVSTARPEDIPEGASPRTYDTDFIVGRVIQRAGLKNVYTYSANTFGPNNGGVASSVSTEGNPWSNPGNILASDGQFVSSTVVSPLTTDKLRITNFNLTLPSTTTPSGISVSVQGFAPDATLYAQLLKAGTPVGEVQSVKLPTTNAFVLLSGDNDLWDASWLYSDIDATGFGIELWVTSTGPATIALDACQLTIYASEGAASFLGLVDANIDSTDQTTLALDSNGLVWQENVTDNPGVLIRAAEVPAVVPGSYMKGVDANGIAYMAYSDLTQGTSQPMQFNGQWCDRITQVGPGQAPTFTPQQASADSFNIATITQPPPNSNDTDPGHISVLLWSAGPGSTAAGNVITVYYSPSFEAPGAEDTTLDDAFNAGQAVFVYISGAPFGNGVYQVTGIGNNLPPGVDHGRWYFTVAAATSNYQNIVEATGQYQMSVATMTTTAPVPGLAVNNQITITGATPSTWDGVWTITEALNSGAVSINATSVAGGVATYDYALISGTAPVAGQLITITGLLNANGALNGANLTIASSTGGATGSFTIGTSAANFATVSETGQGTTAGTIFTFDPGAALAGTDTDPIFGNGTGGSFTFSAAPETFITPGVKQGSVFFITRNGAVTFPANPVTFTCPSNTQSIAATLIPIGPPNVIARGITLTESGQNNIPGASFYTYDTPTKFTVNGTQYVASALIVPDNVTTSAVFTFPDSVLLSSDEIDVQGNNYFNLIEIGSPAWIFQYANRMLYGLCQTKVQNFLNLSFDGGYLPGPSPLPLGWSSTGNVANLTVGLVASADFGNSLQILNTGGSTITSTYLLYQSAYQDFYGVNILQPNTAYSVRFKGRALNADGQQIIISMVPYASGAFGNPLGSVTFTVNQGDFTIQTAALFGALATIPSTLQLAIEVAAITAGAGVQIDRIEIFPTLRPVDTTTIWTSYAGQGGVPNFEAVDVVTGQLGCGDDNQQPTQGAYQILENLYIEKTNSRCVTQDSPNYEPDQWNVPLSSQGSGSLGPNAFFAEEEFSVSASRSGLFLFDGGKPMPISRELQSTGTRGSIWETINFAAASTIWTRFDTNKRQLYVGVPMITPNFWLPNAAASTPNQPNVVLMCNFTGCPTAAELADSMPVHTTMFGDLKALDMRRKWSIWQIVSPVAEFATRQDGVTKPLFLCNGTGTSKIYQLVDGAPTGGQNSDDGAAINWLYTTYGFVKGKQGQQVQGLGALRKIWFYFAATMEGVGQVARKFYSNTLGALPQNIYNAPAATLAYPAQNDQECVLEIGGQRLFVEFSSVGTGGYAEIGPVMLDGEMDKNSPHRGVSS
jgi:hypothetical protein